MNRPNAFSLAAIMALGFASLASSSVAQQASLRDQIVGTWSVVSWEQTRPDGYKDQAFGAKPNGMNIFDPGGHFSLIILRSDLPKVAANDRKKPAPEEAFALATGMIAYFGTYTVDETDRSISLNLEGTSYANQLGRPQKRIVAGIGADELRLRNPTSTDGGQIELVLKRVK